MQIVAGMVSLSHAHIPFFIPVKKQGKLWAFPDVVGVMRGRHSGIDPTHNAQGLKGTIAILA